MNQYTNCTYIFKICPSCHEEVYIGDLHGKICPSCHKDSFKRDKFKCYICKFSSDKKKDLNEHFDNTLHKKNVDLVKKQLFE